jgi:hypothetical protein
MMDLRQDPDRVPGRMVLVGAVIVVITIIVSVLAVVALTYGWRGRLASNPQGATWEGRVPTEVSHVESAIYARATDAERDANAARLRLSTYGWVDRGHERVHVPIDVAMDLILAQGAGAAPAPAGSGGGGR